MESTKYNEENYDRIIGQVRGFGLGGALYDERFTDRIKTSLINDTPTQEVTARRRHGLEHCDFTLVLEKEKEGDRYFLNRIKAEYYPELMIGHEIVAGIDTGALEKELQKYDWTVLAAAKDWTNPLQTRLDEAASKQALETINTLFTLCNESPIGSELLYKYLDSTKFLREHPEIRSSIEAVHNERTPLRYQFFNLGYKVDMNAQKAHNLLADPETWAQVKGLKREDPNIASWVQVNFEEKTPYDNHKLNMRDSFNLVDHLSKYNIPEFQDPETRKTHMDRLYAGERTRVDDPLQEGAQIQVAIRANSSQKIILLNESNEKLDHNLYLLEPRLAKAQVQGLQPNVALLRKEEKPEAAGEGPGVAGEQKTSQPQVNQKQDRQLSTNGSKQNKAEQKKKAHKPGLHR